MGDQKNLLLAILASLVILLGWQYFFEQLRLEAEQAAQRLAAEQTLEGEPGEIGPPRLEPEDGQDIAAGAPALPGDVPRYATVEDARQASPRIRVSTPSLHGTLSLTGARLDDLTLADYRVEADPASPEVTLLTPKGMARPYYVATGWLSADGTIDLPGPDTLWSTDSTILTPDRPVTLSWDNGQGLVFERRIEVDKDYMFSFEDRVINNSGRAVTLFPCALSSRAGVPETMGFFILHEGPIGVLNETLKEYDYGDLMEEGPVAAETGPGGWLGFTDHYWLVSLIPAYDTPSKVRVSHARKDGVNRFQVDMRGEAVNIPAGASDGVATRVFAGAKEVRLLDSYEAAYDIDRFDLAVDFGWFYFLTKPIFYVMEIFDDFLGKYGLAILLLTVIIKLLFFPLANKSYHAMASMKKLQPKLTELREKYKDDKAKMNQELMEMYKRDKINPAAGCLPILIQIPVFFALYKVLFVSIEMRHAPFYGWIQDLSAPDPTSVLNAFGLLPWSVPELGMLNFLNIGIWPLIMGASMYLQQKLNPQPADPIQARMFMLMPIIFTFLLAQFAAGLVIYWAWNNILSIAQQWAIMKKDNAA